MKTTKIQPEKIRYTINEAERTVTAEATNLSLNAWVDIAIVHDKYGECPSGSQNLHIPDTLQGVARCHPDDEWDVEVGKSIARSRLYRRYNHEKAKVIREYVWKLGRIEADLNQMAAVMREYAEREDPHRPEPPATRNLGTSANGKEVD